VLLSLVVLTLLAAPGAGQTCTEQATVGNFEINFMGIAYNGQNTQFTYCITGLHTPALSNWQMALELTCINPEDVVDCGPEPCFYQVNDPHFGLTGIKWDSTEIEPGQTVCYDFTLIGNWTESVGDVTIGLKAGQNVDFGEICGPVCVNCEAAVSVALVAGKPMFGVRLAHNRPPTEVRTVEFALVNKKLDVAHKWVMGPITLKYKDTWEYYGPVPKAPKLPAGEYVLVMKLDGMAGWHWKTQPFLLK
jgi:hypothetical protein